MALPALPFEKVKAMDGDQRTRYFENYARFSEDSPNLCYEIRVGSKTLHSNDTMDLRIQFDKLLRYTRIK